MPNGRLSFFAKYWDFLGVLLLMLASFPTAWLAPRTVTLVPNYGLIDDNWHLDASFKALRGIWVGRDVAFTHGPIYQLLSSIPARSMPLSVGALYVTWNTIPIWCAFLFAYLALRLLMPEQPAWKRFVLLLLLCSFWETSLRTTFPVLLFAIFLRGWYVVREGRVRTYIFGAAGALLWAIAFLIAGDTGVYATAAWFIVCVAIAVETRGEHFAGKLLSVLLTFFLSAVVLVIAINSLMASPLDFRFWRDSLAQVAAYRWATPAAMTAAGELHLFSALLIGTGDLPGACPNPQGQSRHHPPPRLPTGRLSFCAGHAAKRPGALRHRTRDHRRVRPHLFRRHHPVLVIRPRFDRWSPDRHRGFHAVLASYLPAFQRDSSVCSVAKSVN